MTTENWVLDLVAKATRILDAGCGPRGSSWWASKPPESYMLAVDLHFKPPKLPSNSRFIMADIAEFCETHDYAGYFDLIIADHILEHVADPARVGFSFNRVLAMDGLLHVGFPDATMFTDRFYRLIHPEGGGHISQLTLDSLTGLMLEAGFERLDYRPWPDNWEWLKKCYDWKGRGIHFITQEEIGFIADVFLQELTPEKGYYYGWECIFAKREERGRRYSRSSLGDLQPTDIATSSTRSEPMEGLSPLAQATSLFTPAEIVELRWLAYWIRQIKQKHVYQWLKAVLRRLR